MPFIVRDHTFVVITDTCRIHFSWKPLHFFFAFKSSSSFFFLLNEEEVIGISNVACSCVLPSTQSSSWAALCFVFFLWLATPFNLIKAVKFLQIVTQSHASILNTATAAVDQLSWIDLSPQRALRTESLCTLPGLDWKLNPSCLVVGKASCAAPQQYLKLPWFPCINTLASLWAWQVARRVNLKGRHWENLK